MNFIISIAIGVICIVLGIINIKGNISTLHSYHRHRVSKENILPFGRLVGVGTIIMGAGMISFGIASYLAEQLKITALTIVGAVIMIAGFVVGFAFTVYAMIKYNKGIF